MLDIEFEADLPSWAKKLAVFDLETTGLELSTARVVTACVAVIDANADWYLHPSHRLLLCGTAKAPAKRISRLSLRELIEVIEAL